MVELFVFLVAGAVCLAGAVGVVASRNPVHAALSLVATLFGIAVLFLAQDANFLAAVQVIVYAGAIVVLFLFVIMFLGVDQAENLRVEPLGMGQRLAAGILGAGIVALVVGALASTDFETTGVPTATAPLANVGEGENDLNVLGEVIFTNYVYAFEVTSVLLVIAVVGAVVLARRTRVAEEILDADLEERQEQVDEQINAAKVRAGVEVPEPAEEAEGAEEPVEVKA